MKSKLAIIITSSILASSHVLGAPQQGSNNGQPFRALQSQIDENRSLIENNSGAIDAISQSVSEVNIRIDDIDQDISQLESDITNNSSEIVAALERINSNESNLQTLGSELVALAARHDSDLQAVNDALAEIGTKLLALEQARQDLAAQLSDQLAAIGAQVNGNAIAIDSMLFNLVTVNAQLTAINSKIMSLMNRQGQLEENQTEYEEALENLSDQLAELTSRVSALEYTAADDSYSDSFVQGQTSTTVQDQKWVNFRQSLTGLNFNRIEMYSSNGGSASCSDPTLASQITNNLASGASTGVLCNGYYWNVGTCGAAIELAVNNSRGSVCGCDSYASIRPGLSSGNSNWGGIGTSLGGVASTCNAPSQTLSIRLN